MTSITETLQKNIEVKVTAEDEDHYMPTVSLQEKKNKLTLKVNKHVWHYKSIKNSLAS